MPQPQPGRACPRTSSRIECSAKPNSSSSRSRASPNAWPSAGAKSANTSIEVAAGSASQSPLPGGVSLISGTASSAGPASRAACSLAATSSAMSGVPVRVDGAGGHPGAAVDEGDDDDVPRAHGAVGGEAVARPAEVGLGALDDEGDLAVGRRRRQRLLDELLRRGSALIGRPPARC